MGQHTNILFLALVHSSWSQILESFVTYLFRMYIEPIPIILPLKGLCAC